MRPEDSLSTVHPLVAAEIVALPQEIDLYNAPRLCRELTNALSDRTTVLIADMSVTEFCDSSAVRYLLIADKAARSRGAELRIVVQSPAVLKVMRILGVDQVLKFYDSTAAALSAPPMPVTGAGPGIGQMPDAPGGRSAISR